MGSPRVRHDWATDQQLQKWPLGSLYLVQNLPQLGMHVVIFSPIQFLYILLLEERCVQVLALQQKGPRPHPVSDRLQNVQLRKRLSVFPGVSLSLSWVFQVVSTFWLWGVKLLRERKSKPRQVDLPASPSRPPSRQVVVARLGKTPDQEGEFLVWAWLCPWLLVIRVFPSETHQLVTDKVPSRTL